MVFYKKSIPTFLNDCTNENGLSKYVESSFHNYDRLVCEAVIEIGFLGECNRNGCDYSVANFHQNRN